MSNVVKDVLQKAIDTRQRKLDKIIEEQEHDWFEDMKAERERYNEYVKKFNSSTVEQKLELIDEVLKQNQITQKAYQLWIKDRGYLWDKRAVIEKEVSKLKNALYILTHRGYHE